jgi:hypothetical protein
MSTVDMLRSYLPREDEFFKDLLWDDSLFRHVAVGLLINKKMYWRTKQGLAFYDRS